MINRRFKIEKVEVGGFSTHFDIKDLDHRNGANLMSSEAFFHHIAELCGLRLKDIEGFEFSVNLPIDANSLPEKDSLDNCGKIIHVYGELE